MDGLLNNELVVESSSNSVGRLFFLVTFTPAILDSSIGRIRLVDLVLHPAKMLHVLSSTGTGC